MSGERIYIEAQGPTAPLAILIALLTALEHQP